jgi:hypothetical protein
MKAEAARTFTLSLKPRGAAADRCCKGTNADSLVAVLRLQTLADANRLCCS